MSQFCQKQSLILHMFVYILSMIMKRIYFSWSWIIELKNIILPNCCLSWDFMGIIYLKFPTLRRVDPNKVECLQNWRDGLDDLSLTFQALELKWKASCFLLKCTYTWGRRKMLRGVEECKNVGIWPSLMSASIKPYQLKWWTGKNPNILAFIKYLNPHTGMQISSLMYL